MGYTEDMDNTQTIGAREARPELGALIDAAHYAGQHTIITKAGKPRAVLVPYEWYVKRQEKP